MVTLIFLICDGIEFSTGRSKFSSGKRIKTLSSSNDLSFTLFDRMFPIILLCPIFDEIPIDDIFLLFPIKLLGLISGNVDFNILSLLNSLNDSPAS